MSKDNKSPGKVNDPFASPADDLVSPVNAFVEKGLKAYFASGLRASKDGPFKSVSEFFNHRPGLRTLAQFGIFAGAVTTASATGPAAALFGPLFGSAVGYMVTNNVMAKLHRNMPGQKDDGTPIMNVQEQAKVREKQQAEDFARTMQQDMRNAGPVKRKMTPEEARQFVEISKEQRPVWLNLLRRANTPSGCYRGEGLMGSPAKRFAVYATAGIGLTAVFGPATVAAAMAAKWVNSKITYAGVADMTNQEMKNRQVEIAHKMAALRGGNPPAGGRPSGGATPPSGGGDVQGFIEKMDLNARSMVNMGVSETLSDYAKTWAKGKLANMQLPRIPRM